MIQILNLKFDGVRIQEKDGLHGLAAWMSVHDLNVGNDQASYTAIYVFKGVNNKDNSIQTGWMVKLMLMLFNLSFYMIFFKYFNLTYR